MKLVLRSLVMRALLRVPSLVLVVARMEENSQLALFGLVHYWAVPPAQAAKETSTS